MKLYVINLVRSPDRLSYMHDQMKDLDLSFERVEAIDAELLVKSEAKKYSRDNDLYELSLAEAACFLSHRACWKLIAEGEDGYSAVFEDDVLLSKKSCMYLKNNKWVPSDVDIIKIETYGDITCLYRWNYKKINNGSLVRLGDFHTGAAGYILSKKMATFLLSMSENSMPCAVDHFIFDPRWKVMQTQIVYQLIPAICVQSDRLSAPEQLFGTTITERSKIIRPPLKKELNALSKIKRELFRPFLKVIRYLKYKKIAVDLSE